MMSNKVKKLLDHYYPKLDAKALKDIYPLNISDEAIEWMKRVTSIKVYIIEKEKEK